MKSTKSTKSTKSATKSQTKARSSSAPSSMGQDAMEKFKFEVASEIGVPLKQGYNGDLTSAQTGYVGGYMVKKMIEAQEKQMSGNK